MRRIYDENILKYITVFESLSGAGVRDCIVDDERIIFIVEPGNMGLAIGKHGSTLKRIENVLKKPLKLMEFSDDIAMFIKNYTYPINMFEVIKEGKIITIKGKDTKTKAILIGRDRANIKKTLNVVKRFFDVEDIRVV